MTAYFNSRAPSLAGDCVLLATALFTATACVAGPPTDRLPKLHLAVDTAYGRPPHTVRLKATLAPSPLDLRKHPLLPWYEDLDNTSRVEAAGATLHMTGNAAKMLQLDYVVTSDTILSFDFQSIRQGEIHAIGFDNDRDLDVASARRMFVLHGTEGWGIANNVYRHYQPAPDSDGWVHYRIPVGRYFQGAFKYLVFMNDHDVTSPTADSRFRHVSLSEASLQPTDYQIRWDLGDLQTATAKWSVAHTYDQPGLYVVRATASHTGGHVATHQINIRVKHPPRVRRTLFLDDQALQTTSGVQRVVHRALKHPGNPILVGDQPWDAYRPQVYGTVQFDAQRNVFRMWYLAIPSHVLSPDPEPFVGGFKRIGHTTLVGYAESQDGYRWIKPKLDIVSFNGSKANGLVNLGRDNSEGVSIVHQPLDPDPMRRYKAIFWEHRVEPTTAPTGREALARDPRGDGMWVSFSADGLHWKSHPGNPVIPQGSDTGQCVLYDPTLKKYILYSRLGVGRRISRCVSDDFLTWSQPELVFAADAADPPGTEIYGSGISRYEGYYIGTPWMFYRDTNQRIDVQLIHSRDGIHWRRTAGRERILPNGPEGAWDSGIIFTACQPVVLDDRILIYYSAFQGDHHGHPERDWEESQQYYRGGIGVATLRRDGWVSLDLSYGGGEILTRPLRIPPATNDDDTPRLLLNTNAFTGDVRVTVQNLDGTPIPGFENSRNLHGDFLRSEVTWSRGHSLAELVGRRVQLKIHGRLARIYSYWFE